ncbi:MAG: methyltransferase domain-containing protein [Propionicimonas sp.]
MMRKGTKAALGVGAAAITGMAFAFGRYRKRKGQTALPDVDSIFTVFAPGGSQAFWCNGPLGWVTSKIMPIVEADVYRTVADMIQLRPDDCLLDIGCGPGGFLTAQAKEVRQVVGMDASPLMLQAAERRLADRIAAGTAKLVDGNAAALPFGEGEFSAAVAIYAPASPSEAFRVLRPGGRLVIADPEPARTPTEAGSASYDRRLLGESDYRRMLTDAGFTDVEIRFGPGGLYALGCKPYL